METTARNRRIRRTLLILLLLAGLAGWGTYRAFRQDALNTQLISALRRGDAKTAITLLNAGADANTRDYHGARRTFVEHFTVLLSRLRGQKDYLEDWPALLLTMEVQFDVRVLIPENPQLVQAFLDKGANVNATNWAGETALTLAARHNYLDTARLLLKHGANVNIGDIWSQHTPLLWASANRSFEMVQLLVEAGADVNCCSELKDKPLYYAAQYGRKDVVSLLLKRGANVNAAGLDGHTALMLAVEFETPELAQILLDAGADPNLASESGQTALSIAGDHRRTETIKLLKQRGAKK